MLVGLFFRHFKTYKGARYVPFGSREIDNFNLFIGQNGVGKSSILEALDYYFNDSDFVMHHSETKKEAFVAPLFLIPREKLGKFDPSIQELIPIISDILYGIKKDDSSNYNRYDSFFDHLDLLKKYQESHFLLTLASHPYNDDDRPFFTFNDHVIKGIKSSKNLKSEILNNIEKSIKKIKHGLHKIYSFQYIPVETSLAEFLRLESKGMQDLMSEDVKKTIEDMLNEKSLNDIHGSSKNYTMLDFLNKKLEDFISNIELTIKNIDPNYSFNKDFNARAKLTANHLTDIIIESYFAKRKLKLNNKPIEHLSAGERKRALVDIAYAFLTQDKNRNSDQNIILAIDEPESSLHISMCYNQFLRLLELAKDFNVQMFITTHWYGSLPIMDKGNLYYIHNEDQNKISEFSFKNYFQENGKYPEDIYFKSFFDLASSIISSLRFQEKNWLIVEGTDDKNYITKHLTRETLDNLIILPVGGCSIVMKVYEYLFLPLSQKNESKYIKNKVVCLVDTDFQAVLTSYDIKSQTKDNNLIIRRLQCENNKIRLSRIENPNRTPTEIEECLIPKIFYQALKIVIERNADENLKNIFNNFVFDDKGAKNSFICSNGNGSHSIIYFKSDSDLKGNPDQYKDQIHEFVNKNKSLICDEYCKIETNESPEWIKDLENLFK